MVSLVYIIIWLCSPQACINNKNKENWRYFSSQYMFPCLSNAKRHPQIKTRYVKVILKIDLVRPLLGFCIILLQSLL